MELTKFRWSWIFLRCIVFKCCVSQFTISSSIKTTTTTTTPKRVYLFYLNVFEIVFAYRKPTERKSQKNNDERATNSWSWINNKTKNKKVYAYRCSVIPYRNDDKDRDRIIDHLATYVQQMNVLCVLFF